MEPILRAENLTKIFDCRGKKPFTAVDHVSFSLQQGETLGIIGESGSGKTTVANLLARLMEPTKGRICLEGQDITEWRGKALKSAYRKMQMVFQNPALSFDPRRTLGNGIEESLRNNGVSRAQARERAKGLLSLCGLPETFYRRYPHQVSGGQCQRAAIARAIAIEPAILICDEATSALDVTIQQEILELLTALKDKRRMAYLFICHDIALVRQFCDRVLVMYRGRIVEEGSPDEVIGNPREEYTKMLIDSVL